MSLTWRTSGTGALHAGYLGECRVAYVSLSRGTYLWNTALIRPTGGYATGREETLEAAHAAVETAVAAWVAAANLKVAKATFQNTSGETDASNELE